MVNCENEETSVRVIPKNGMLPEGFAVRVNFFTSQVLPGKEGGSVDCPGQGDGCLYRKRFFRNTDTCEVELKGFKGILICGKSQG